MSHQLRIVSGPKKGHTVVVAAGQTYTIGRAPDAPVSIPEDQTLSRAHAELINEGGQWIIRNKSQHGTLMGGEVFQDQRPIQEGAQFQVGDTQIMFEAAPAGATPAAGGAVGGAVGGGGGDAGADAKAAAAAALASLGEGAVKIDGSQPGFPFGEIIKGGFSIAKQNLFASLCLFAPISVLVIAQYATMFALVALEMASLVGIAAIVFGVLGLLVMILQPLLVLNYVQGVKHFQETGEKMGIGSLLKFDNLVGKYVTLFVVWITGICCGIPPMILAFAIPIIIDKPEAGIGGAIKGGLAFGKRNIVPMILLCIICGIVAGLGSIACGIGILFTYPAMIAAGYLAYECKRGEVESAAAEDGVAL